MFVGCVGDIEFGFCDGVVVEEILSVIKVDFGEICFCFGGGELGFFYVGIDIDEEIVCFYCCVVFDWDVYDLVICICIDGDVLNGSECVDGFDVGVLFDFFGVKCGD